jgi:pimeloyl-ACP methyl ester carboxylesterase
MRRLDLGAVQLEFQERGRGDPVLLIHAALLADWFTPLVAQTPLTESCRLINYHRVGFAGSTHTTAPLSIVDQSRHARELLAELGIGRAHLVGHSSGACIALQVALDAPDLVQSLALLEPVVASGPLAEEFAHTEVGPAFARYFAGDHAGAVDLFMRAIGGPEYRLLIERTLGVGALEQIQADADTFFQTEGPAVNAWRFDAAEAARVQKPVLLVGGAESRPVYHEGHTWLLERLPCAEGQVAREANHLLPLQQPRQLAGALARFFAVHSIADSR